MGDAQPISERVSRRQGLFESLPFLSDNTAAKVCGCLYTKEFYERQFKNIWSEGFLLPVPKGQLVELNINEEKDPHYKFLLQAESREINKQKCRIRKNAEIVYNHKKRNGNLTPLAKRTNDFEMLEKLSRDFW